MSDRVRHKCWHPSRVRHLDIHDLAAAIVEQARHEWQAPNRVEIRTVCWGEEHLGFRKCPYRQDCWPKGRDRPNGKRYRECIYRRTALKQELVEFFSSPWFDVLCGEVDSGYVRQTLGVPTL